MKNNKIVYVITNGSYSDYHICAVTLDKNRAEELKDVYDVSYCEARIEEYELDEMKKDNRIVFDIKFVGNKIDRIASDEYDCLERVERFSGDIDESWVRVLASDVEHAKKRAFDVRAEYLAEQYGITIKEGENGNDGMD